MDTAAFALARDAKLPIAVFSIQERGSIAAVLKGKGRSTLCDVTRVTGNGRSLIFAGHPTRK